MSKKTRPIKVYWNGYEVGPELARLLSQEGEHLTTDEHEWFWRIWND